MTDKRRLSIRILALAAALILITSGVILGGGIDVFSRAVTICLDCMGIG